jgi:hypothetical protein
VRSGRVLRLAPAAVLEKKKVCRLFNMDRFPLVVAALPQYRRASHRSAASLCREPSNGGDVQRCSMRREIIVSDKNILVKINF